MEEKLSKEEERGEKEEKVYSNAHTWRDHGWMQCHKCTTHQQIYCHSCLLCYPCAIRNPCTNASSTLRRNFTVTPSFAQRKVKTYGVIFPDLYMAAKEGDLARLKLLMKTDSKLINDEDENDNTPLYYAILCGHPEVIIFLVQNGATINWNSANGHRYFLAAQNPLVREMVRQLSQGNMNLYPLLNSQKTSKQEEKFLNEETRAEEGIFRYLPSDSWMDIFAFLSDHALVMASQVCKAWNRIVRSDRLWKNYYLSACGTSPIWSTITSSFYLDSFFDGEDHEKSRCFKLSYKDSYFMVLSKLYSYQLKNKNVEDLLIWVVINSISQTKELNSNKKGCAKWIKCFHFLDNTPEQTKRFEILNESQAVFVNFLRSIRKENYDISYLHFINIQFNDTLDVLEVLLLRPDIKQMSLFYDEFNCSPIEFCIIKHKPHFLRRIITIPNFNLQSDLLFLCIRTNSLGCLSILLPFLSNELDKVDRNVCNPLMLCCQLGNVEALKLILPLTTSSHMAAVDADGYTALHLAVLHEHLEVTSILLASEADPTHLSTQGISILRLIQEINSYQLQKSFQQLFLPFKKQILKAEDNFQLSQGTSIPPVSFTALTKKKKHTNKRIRKEKRQLKSLTKQHHQHSNKFKQLQEKSKDEKLKKEEEEKLKKEIKKKNPKKSNNKTKTKTKSKEQEERKIGKEEESQSEEELKDTEKKQSETDEEEEV